MTFGFGFGMRLVALLYIRRLKCSWVWRRAGRLLDNVDQERMQSLLISFGPVWYSQNFLLVVEILLSLKRPYECTVNFIAQGPPVIVRIHYRRSFSSPHNGFVNSLPLDLPRPLAMCVPGEDLVRYLPSNATMVTFGQEEQRNPKLTDGMFK